jgi:type IV pilus assembly protein PilV
MKARRLAIAGITLIEALVTLVIMSVGILGVAKMQAAALSNTQVSRVRSLVALQAESLAAIMRSNRGYWGALGVTRSFSAAGATITSSATGLTGSTDCASSTCTSEQLAAYDVQRWIAGMNTQFPSYTADVACATAAAPVSCTIRVAWSEKYVAVNLSTAASAPAMTSTQALTLHVQP